MLLTLPLAPGRRYLRRDGTITPPLTLECNFVVDPETNYIFEPNVPFVVSPELHVEKDLVAEVHRTRNGRPVYIVKTDLKDRTRPILAIVIDEDGTEFPILTTADGYCYGRRLVSDLDIITMIPPLKLQIRVGSTYECDNGNRYEIVYHDEARNLFVGFDMHNATFSFDPLGEATDEPVQLVKEITK